MNQMNTKTPKLKKTNMITSVFNLRELYGQGRARILTSSVLDNVVAQLTTGVFYTSFLLYYGMDKSSIGFLTFIPYITCLLNIFSPSILERFRKRKAILITVKLTECFITFIGIALLPTLVQDQNARLTGLAILIILSTALGQLFTSGWNAWNANYLQDHVRVNYFFVANCILNMIAHPTALIISFIADKFADTPNEIILLTAMRYIAFGLMLVDALIWIFQKEFPYEKSTDKVKLSAVFAMPLKNRKFMMVMVLLFLYNFAGQLPNATLNAYLLEDVGVSYTLIAAINACYFLFFFLFTGMWNAVICKFNRYYAFGLALLLQGASFIAYAFVSSDTIWLYIVVRLIQHVTGVLLSGVCASILYDHLPNTDRTNYLSFNFIVTNGAIFLALMADTLLAGLWGNGAISILGMPVYSTQITIFVSAVLQLLLGRLALKWSRSLA